MESWNLFISAKLWEKLDLLIKNCFNKFIQLNLLSKKNKIAEHFCSRVHFYDLIHYTLHLISSEISTYNSNQSMTGSTNVFLKIFLKSCNNYNILSKMTLINILPSYIKIIALTIFFFLLFYVVNNWIGILFTYLQWKNNSIIN